MYTLGSGGGVRIWGVGYRYQITACACLVTGAVVGQLSVPLRVGLVAAVVRWRISSYWLDETVVSRVLAGCIGLVSICNR